MKKKTPKNSDYYDCLSSWFNNAKSNAEIIEQQDMGGI